MSDDLIDRARAALDGVTPDSELTILYSEWFCEIGYVDGNGMDIWEETIESHPLKTLAQAEALRDEWLKSGKLYRTSWGEIRPTGVNYGAFRIRKGSRILPAARSLVPEMADRIESLEAEALEAEALLAEAVEAGEALAEQAAHVQLGGCIPAVNIHKAAQNLAEPLKKWDAFLARIKEAKNGNGV